MPQEPWFLDKIRPEPITAPVLGATGSNASEAQAFAAQAGGKDKGKGGSKGQYVTTEAGQEICFKWSRAERGAGCADICPVNRAHVCRYCLQPHKMNASGKQPQAN